MWEPFSQRARRAVVRSQVVAQMFGAHFIGTEHMIFALAETDDPVGEALAKSVDRDALREQLGSVSEAPVVEMVFTSGAKRSIELAFESARRLNHDYIGTAHLALGILGSAEPPPLLEGHDAAALRAELERVSTHEGDSAREDSWDRLDGGEPHPIADTIMAALRFRQDKIGTRVTLTVAAPDEPERTWSWIKQKS